MIQLMYDPQDFCIPGDPMSISVAGDCPSMRSNFICTRDTGHQEQHVACSTERVCATWTVENTTNIRTYHGVQRP